MNDPSPNLSPARGSSFWAACAGPNARDRRNLAGFLVAMFAWAVCFVAASQLLEREMVEAGGVVAFSLVALPAVAGLAVIAVYARFLDQGDELQRLIHYRALALAFGVSFFATGILRLLERAEGPVLDLADLALVMAVVYTATLFHQIWRYR
ncbi:MAG: hypothetical protein DWQ36_07555 [Acidobacteria bacterium]|nr:MAG: hypothetical protein DWQ30_11760 [Acidobacteriota bacterium]REK09173.1 MAG: hypothetical protein DWQ36_07555 [Acidobacteriota bacterium]